MTENIICALINGIFAIIVAIIAGHFANKTSKTVITNVDRMKYKNMFKELSDYEKLYYTIDDGSADKHTLFLEKGLVGLSIKEIESLLETDNTDNNYKSKFENLIKDNPDGPWSMRLNIFESLKEITDNNPRLCRKLNSLKWKNIKE